MRRFRVGILLSSLLLSLPVFAGTPDKVQCPAQINCQKCTVDDGAGNKTCKIQLSRASVTGAWVATAQALDKNNNPVGTTNQDICLDSTVPVTFVSDPNINLAFFEVVFGSNNPFAGFNPTPAIFPGGMVSGKPVPGKATLAGNSKGCYQFDITFCQYAAATPINCVTADPQVIVDGGDRMEMCSDECRKKQLKEEALKECIRHCQKKDQNKDKH